MSENTEDQLTKVVDALNEAFRRDKGAVHALLCNRVPCNQDLADDPFVQVGQNKQVKTGWEVGMLGFINGVLEAAGIPKVASQWSDDETPELLGFQPYTPAS